MKLCMIMTYQGELFVVTTFCFPLHSWIGEDNRVDKGSGPGSMELTAFRFLPSQPSILHCFPLLLSHYVPCAQDTNELLSLVCSGIQFTWNGLGGTWANSKSCGGSSVAAGLLEMYWLL